MIKGTEVAMIIGFATGLLTMVIGVFLGAIAGYFGGKVDEAIVWFYTTFSSIPGIMLLTAITFILGKGIIAVFLALGLTSWVSLCRLIRADVIRHKNREYVVFEGNRRLTCLRKLIRENAIAPTGVDYENVSAYVYPPDYPSGEIEILKRNLQTGKKDGANDE